MPNPTPSMPPLPEPYDYCYEWDGPYGTRKFSTAPHNGRQCDKTVSLFSAAQMHAYAQSVADARVREATDSLRLAGAALANCAFNLAQRNPGQFTTRDIEVLDKARKDWDAAIRSLAAQKGTT